jgi:adenylate kinase family enzyme
MKSRSQSRSWPHDLSLQRVLVVGSCGAGKSTFARALAPRLGRPVVELDAFHWGPDWTPKPREAFRALAAAAAAREGWIADGNYSAVRDLLWPRAQTVFWLNYPFHTVMVRRSLGRQTLWHGNRETLAMAVGRDGVPREVWRTWARRQRVLTELRAANTYPGLTWIEFLAPAQAQAFVEALDATCAGPAEADQFATGRVA